MRRAMVCVGALLGLAACSGSDGGGKLPDEAVTKVAGAAAGSMSASPAVPPTSAQTEPTKAAEPAKPAEPVKPVDTASQGTPTQPPAAMPGAMPPSTPSTPTVQGIAPPDGFKPNAMNECGINTGWPGDNYCILPPPPDKGFQLHIGPSDYKNPEPQYILAPGQEYVHTFMNTSANDHDIKFYIRQYRMRPGAHHTIVRDTSTGRRLSGSDVNQDHPVGGITAPENAGIGIPLAAHAPISTDHHAINTTDHPLLQEVWVNFWYVDPAKVTESTNLLYDPGSISDTVAPHADVVLGPYQCDIKTQGRLISMFGHVHANNVRFSAWRTRAGKKDLIYEAYHWEEPLWLEFTSLAKNPIVDAEKKLDGGWTGVLDLQPGDTLAWECHEVNQRDTTLKFTNKTYDGQMCIIIGELVGTKCMSRNAAAAANPIIE